ncbi:PLP-dependent aminotransferase family protein [Methylobacterium sp. J-078]|uniref:aminotransferase-like domain-containing protein n=1 Tax=Methylobacterium sp. J-078 TaxID=2836657 RepID=UPI001FB977C7|nr:PLP-dependent aminotransferase family protein [Methylobacterium sp. J-078]MCJ2045298.1 PLP-dependent aminotransferase family protein [Methylobacterium sp. J-078]
MDYRTISDGIAADIAAGRLAPGTRLPPQRQFAYERGIAVSTASRVYAELTRRGLVTGEVGRGTFIRAPVAAEDTALAETETGLINLEHVFSILPQQAADLSASLSAMLEPAALRAAFPPVRAGATARARTTASGFFTRGGWSADPETVLFTGAGRQGIAAAMAALAQPGERIGVEALTYPIVKGMAARIGITLVPLALDADGVHPDAIAQAHRDAPLRGLYLQSVLQSPLGRTMSAERRRAIARLLAAHDLVCIEDAVYGFLCDEEPLAALAPDRVILVDSLSKRVAPGLSLGFVASPPALVERLTRTIRNGAWTAGGLPLAIALHVIADGLAGRIGREKRADAAARHALAREMLAGLDIQGDPRAYHLWLTLPEAWNAERYAAAAARNGVAVSPASAFAIGPAAPPNGVRLALGSPPLARLGTGLQILRSLALNGDEAHVE